VVGALVLSSQQDAERVPGVEDEPLPAPPEAPQAQPAPAPIPPPQPMDPPDVPADPSATRTPEPCPRRLLGCPAGTTHRASLEGDDCQQSCTDARGNVVARSTESAVSDPPASTNASTSAAADWTQRFWNKRLACTYRTGQRPSCAYEGAEIALRPLDDAAHSGWRVARAEGPAPAVAGARCQLEITPYEAQGGPSGGPPFNCRVALRCGQLVYGGGSSGNCLCDIGDQGQIRGAIDYSIAATDGDPVLALDLAKRRLFVADRSWRLRLSPLP
jgi:hypothetical protein